ncbi:MAG: PIG-L deacetylase family protein [Actinomycetota bacterium]|nr:PIG-L deacetylase family protein [Actinomycetota bacterium]
MRDALPEELAGLRSPVVVVAHPDDESFGLGAVVASLVDGGASVAQICLTRGEASTLGVTRASTGADPTAPLASRRANELERAAAALGIGPIVTAAHADGHLAEVDPDALVSEVVHHAMRLGADGFVVFDSDGITGHPDHRAATRAALGAAAHLDVPVVAWTVPTSVAETLNAELGTGFVGRADDEVDVRLRVDRTRQLEAIACHRSQSGDNAVLWRRLELMGETEALRWLRRPPAAAS